MQITADKLRERITSLEAQRDQMLANANAFNGAAMECRYWLGELEKAEVKDPTLEQQVADMLRERDAKDDPTGWGLPDGATINEP